MFRLGSLDYEQTLLSTPSAPASELLQKLEPPLVRPVVFLSENRVGLKYGHKGQSAEVESLGNHPCADQYVDFSVGEFPDSVGLIFPALCRVAVHTCDPCVREDIGRFLLNLLRA